jgi:hypothetical protein
MTNFYVIGFLATGAILAWLPQGALEGIVGGGLAGMVAACALGTVLYLCASSATPLAAVLVAKGMSPGTALVLLLAGPATSLASMVAVRAMLGLRGLLLYLASIIACALVLGVALDAAAAWWSLPPFAEGLADGHEAASLATQVLTIALVGLFAWSYVRRLWPGGGSGSHAHGESG